MNQHLFRAGFACLSVIALGLTAACSDDDDDELQVTPTPVATVEPTQANAPDEVQVTDADNGATLQLAGGGELIVALPANPSTGFSWSVSEASDPKLELQGEPRFVPPGSTSPVVGAGGTEVFTFEANGAGIAELKLEYRRSFEPGVPPEDTFELTVEIR